MLPGRILQAFQRTSRLLRAAAVWFTASFSLALLGGCGALENAIKKNIEYAQICDQCDVAANAEDSAHFPAALAMLVEQRLAAKTSCPELLPNNLARQPTCELKEILVNSGTIFADASCEAANHIQELANSMDVVGVKARELLTLIRGKLETSNKGQQTPSQKTAAVLRLLANSDVLVDLQNAVVLVKNRSETIAKDLENLAANSKSAGSSTPVLADQIKNTQIKLRAWQQNVNAMLDKGLATLGDPSLLQRDLSRLAVESYVARNMFDLIERTLTPLEKQISTVDEKSYGTLSVGLLFGRDEVQSPVDSAIENVLNQFDKPSDQNTNQGRSSKEIAKAFGRVACQRLFKPDTHLSSGYIGPLVARGFINIAYKKNGAVCTAPPPPVQTDQALSTQPAQALSNEAIAKFQQYWGFESKLRQVALEQKMRQIAAAAPNTVLDGVAARLAVYEPLIEEQATILAGVAPNPALNQPQYPYGDVAPLRAAPAVDVPATSSKPAQTTTPQPTQSTPLCGWVPRGLSCEQDATGSAVIHLPGFNSGIFTSSDIAKNLTALRDALQRAGLRASVEVHGHASREGFTCKQVQNWLTHPPKDWPWEGSGVPVASPPGASFVQSRWPQPCQDAHDDGNRALSLARAAWAARILDSRAPDPNVMTVQRILGWGSVFAQTTPSGSDRRVTLYVTLLPPSAPVAPR